MELAIVMIALAAACLAAGAAVAVYVVLQDQIRYLRAEREAAKAIQAQERRDWSAERRHLLTRIQHPESAVAFDPGMPTAERMRERLTPVSLTEDDEMDRRHALVELAEAELAARGIDLSDHETAQLRDAEPEEAPWPAPTLAEQAYVDTGLGLHS